MVLRGDNCAGTASNVLYQQKCTISLSTLRDTFSLAQGELVVAQISATNSYGTSELS